MFRQYLATRPQEGRKSFPRCAAVDMPGLFRKGTSPEQTILLEEQGYLLLDYDEIRPLKIMREFYDDLEAHDKGIGPFPNAIIEIAESLVFQAIRRFRID